MEFYSTMEWNEPELLLLRKYQAMVFSSKTGFNPIQNKTFYFSVCLLSILNRRSKDSLWYGKYKCIYKIPLPVVGGLELDDP